MSMIIGTGNSNRTVYTIKNADGSTAATFSVSKKTSKSKAKKKRLPYNFKQLSKQILSSKTSSGARRAAAKARGIIAGLLKKLKNGEYDDQEVANAILHARKMERIARKRMKHMQEEEMAKRGSSCLEELEEQESDSEELGEAMDPVMEMSMSETLDNEEWKELMRQFEELMASLMEESMEEFSDAMELSDLTEELTGAVSHDMDPEDLRSLKKKHRAQELREITEADMKYLQAMFQKLERERQENASGGVSLEIAGVEMPVQVEAPIMIEGGNMDVSV